MTLYGKRYARLNKRLALVVDDEAVNRELLGFILQDDYDILPAGDGREAMRLLRERGADISVLLLDLLMPVMSGFDVLHEMRTLEAARDIPVIVLTSEARAEVECLKLGAVDFIKKPYNAPEAVLARVNRVVELFEDRQLIEAAENDPLTGLYNRAFFYEYAGQRDRQLSDCEMDAVALDIDRFRLLNEMNGRAYGDRVLRAIGGVLAGFAGEHDGLAARCGSDLFYLYCRHQESYEPLRRRLGQVLDELSDAVRIRVRFGVYPAADKEMEMEHRFDRAKAACDAIRDDYKQCVNVYSDELHAREVYAERLMNDMGEAIASGQFCVYYQPKFNIRGEEPVLCSAEALVRWRHPELGFISPGVFIPLFEQNGLISQLERHIWERAAAQMREWKDRFGVSIPVSVNVSRIDLYDPNLGQWFAGLMEKYALSPGEYWLEITESAYTEDTAQLLAMVSALREAGFKVEMDDFGSGYSSLNMLFMMPVDALKLDMKFVQNIEKSGKNREIIRVLMNLAGCLGVPTIVEGVEEQEQVDMLKSAGCDIIQGYYFSRPLPPEEFERFIKGGKEEC